MSELKHYQWLIPLILVLWPSPGDAKKQPPGAIRLEQVSYSGQTYRAVRQDDDSGSYDAPHWQDRSNPPDGDAMDVDDRKFPVSFVRGDNVVVSAAWHVNPPAAFQNSMVRGKGRFDLSMNVPPTAAVLAGNTLTVTDVTMTGTLPATVKFFNEFTIRWEVSVDGGQNWFPAGTSGNRMYVRLAAPANGVRSFETVLEIGTRNADGESEPAAVVAAVWRDFSNPQPGVKRKALDGFNRRDEREMTYWKNPGQACETMEQMISSSTGDGKCDAWARLFHEALGDLGVPGSKRVQVTSRYRNDAGLSLPGIAPGDSRGGMFVKNWSMANAVAAIGTCQPFTHDFGMQTFSDLPGVPGQGNPNPVAMFLEHYIVEYDGKYYDPSYGGSRRDTQAAWEDASIDFFGKMCVTGPNTASIVMKTNDPGVETVFTPL